MSSGNMISVSSLGNEKVWLEKPKYDAAEKRYYNKLVKSSVKKCVQTEVRAPRYIPLINCCNPETKPKPCDCNFSNTFIRDVPTSSDSDDENQEGKLKVRPEPRFCRSTYDYDSDEEKPYLVRRPTYPFPLEGICHKYEEEKKKDPFFINLNASKVNSDAPKKLDTSEASCPKVKGHNKSKVSIDDSKQEASTEPNISVIEPVSEVVKLKGFYLQSKYLPYQPDSLKNKGTNVNTIPEISKITPCYDKSKNVQNNMKKVPIPNPLPDKQHSVDLIIPSDSTNDLHVEDQVKKDTKKKKRHRKDRHRKQDVSQTNTSGWSSIASEVAKARQHIKNSLACIDDIAVTSNTVSIDIISQVKGLEKNNVDLKNEVKELADQVKKMDTRISAIEKSTVSVAQPAAVRPQAPLPPQADNADDNDDGVDLFGSDSEEEDTEAAKLKEARLAEYAAKKAGKKPIIAKSSIILDVKPWDDETNMKELEKEVRKITTEGLVWGTSKLVPLAYGIHKLQISCCVEDEKVSVDWLQETIQEIEDYVQSVDIAAFNKV